MSLDAFGLAGAQPAHGPPPAVGVFLGPWPSLDRHGNVYWWQCLEPRCLYRTQPEARGGTAWAAQQRAHGAESHLDRDSDTVGHPTSLGGCHVGALPDSYDLRGEGWVVSADNLATHAD